MDDPEDDPATTPTVEAGGAGAHAAPGRDTVAASDTVAHGDTLASAPRAAAGGVVAGRRLGRYVVERRLGAGGMGEVLAAHDPELDRPVAIKLLRGELGDHGAERLRREARTMARLSHRNLVAVHDVGEHDGQVFLAMELVDGGTLRGFERGRSWREVLAAYLDAGRGLAAAHDAGVVHRDFKPDNVLRGKDGRIAVTDFGIARRRPHAAGDGDDRGAVAPVDPSLTRTGAMVGTPLYMAPEQLDGATADARSDQFAFAVALWEALYGAHPLVPRGADLAALSAAMRRGDALTPPGGPVPTRVARALIRALHPDPAARWPSLRALLDALDGHAPRRRRRAAVAVVGTGLAVGAVVVGVAAVRAPASARCAPAPRLFDDAWGPARAEAVRVAFAASGRSYQADQYARVAATLDGYRGAWVETRVAVCEATHVRGEQSAALLDRRVACLDERRRLVAGVVAVLAAPDDPAVVDEAVTAVRSLPTPGRCAEATADGVALPDDPAARQEIEALRAAVVGVRALGVTGRHAAGVAAAEALRARVDATGFAPLRAALGLALGTLYNRVGRHADAERVLDDAAGAAATAGDAALEAEIWTLVLETVALRLGRLAEADLIVRAAASAVARAGDRSDLRSELLRVQAIVVSQQGDYPRAVALADEAVAIADRDPAAAAERPRALQTAARMRVDAGQLAEALPLLERAAELVVQTHGDAHPDLALVLDTRGRALRATGDYAAATAAFTRALAIFEATYGPDGAPTVGPRNNLATVLAAQERYDEAAAAFAGVAAAIERHQGPDAPALGVAYTNLGNVLSEAGRPADAIPHLRRALALRERLLGPDHEDVAWSLNSLGHTLRVTGALDEARALQARALALLERLFGARHGWVAYALDELAQLDLAQGRAEDAVRHAERALAARTQGPSEPRELETTRFFVAQARWLRGVDRAAAVRLARQARDALRALGQSEADEVDAWLAAHAAR